MQRIFLLMLVFIGLGGCLFGKKEKDDTDSTDSTNPGGSEGILDDNLSKDYPDGIKVMSGSGEYIGDLLYVSKGNDDSIVYNILKDGKYLLPISYEFDSQYGVFNSLITKISVSSSTYFYFVSAGETVGASVTSRHLVYFAPQSIEGKLHQIASDKGENFLIYFFTMKSKGEDFYQSSNTQCFDLSFSEANINDHYAVGGQNTAENNRRIEDGLPVNRVGSITVYGKVISTGTECLKAVFGSEATTVPDYGQMSFINNTDDSTIEESKLSGYALGYK